MKQIDHIYIDDELDLWLERTAGTLGPGDVYALDHFVPEDRQISILEVGTGAGPMSYYLESKGYSNITAFDYLDGMLAKAKEIKQATGSAIEFFQADLRTVSEDEHVRGRRFDSIVCLQQVVSMIPLEDWDKALHSLHQMLADDGTLAIAFLQHEGRPFNVILRAMFSTVRALRGLPTQSYSQPLLQKGGKVNRDLFRRDEYLVHWLPRSMIDEKIRSAGFEIVETTTTGKIVNSNPQRGMYYLKCRRK